MRRTTKIIRPRNLFVPALPSAFTLLELLVVTSIIAVLASLLLPSLSRAKQKAQKARCASNLHQLGIALQNFVTDNHAYPSYMGSTNGENPGWWFNQVEVGGFGNSQMPTNFQFFFRGVWRCPSAPDTYPWPGSDQGGR